MAIYLKWADCDGPVTTKGFEKQIEPQSFQWGMGRGVSMQSGSVQGRESSLPSLSEITITKEYDVSSPGILKKSLNGDSTASLIFSFVRTETGGKGATVYMKVTLSNVIVSGYSISSGGDKPSESISLAYTKVEFADTPMTIDGKPGTQVINTFDLETMVKS